MSRLNFKNSTSLLLRGYICQSRALHTTIILIFFLSHNHGVYTDWDPIMCCWSWKQRFLLLFRNFTTKFSWQVLLHFTWFSAFSICLNTTIFTLLQYIHTKFVIFFIIFVADFYTCTTSKISCCVIIFRLSYIDSTDR